MKVSQVMITLIALEHVLECWTAKAQNDTLLAEWLGRIGTQSENGGNLIRDLFAIITHYISRNDLNNLERLEGIHSDILSGFSEWEKDTVDFYLHNRNKAGSELIKYGSVHQLKKSGFVQTAPLKVLIHGFKMNAFSHFNYLLREAYLKEGEEVNVLVVGWRRLASDIYFNAAFNTRIVGERLGELLVFLKNNGFIENYENVHLLGFSLGAHVAGYAGKYVIKKHDMQVGRITGLDPAGPSFAGIPAKNRLASSDAVFVDVIHTSLGQSGISESIGHVDFFPNGGTDQPGCDWERISDFFLRNCSHERAFYLYLETLRGRQFIGCPCKSWTDFELAKCNCDISTPGAEVMGEFCNHTARGDKYLYVHENYPIINPTQ